MLPTMPIEPPRHGLPTSVPHLIFRRSVFLRSRTVDASHRRRLLGDFRTTACCTTDACLFCWCRQSAVCIDRTCAPDPDPHTRITSPQRMRGERTDPQGPAV